MQGTLAKKNEIQSMFDAVLMKIVVYFLFDHSADLYPNSCDFLLLMLIG